MTRASIRTIAALAVLAAAATALAQEETTYEQGPDGVTYKVTRRVVQRSIPTTEYQTREQKVFRPQVATEYQTYQQNYVTPVTEYQWVPRLRGVLNPFTGPYWTHELAPVTRWEARTGTTHVPVARTDWVEEVRTTHVPVTTYRTVPEEYTSRVAVSVAPGASTTSIASRPIGGQQLQSDPPRQEISEALGSEFNGDLPFGSSGELFVFAEGDSLVRFADYRGRATFEGFERPVDELARAEAVLRVRRGVVSPAA
jgi:hypothetical protein